MAKLYTVYSWFDGNGLRVEKGIVKGRTLTKPRWQKRGSYPDPLWARRAKRQIEREEKTKVEIRVTGK